MTPEELLLELDELEELDELDELLLEELLVLEELEELLDELELDEEPVPGVCPPQPTRHSNSALIMKA